MRLLPPTLLVCLLATGCGLNTAVLQTGGNGRLGVLLNYSCGAHVCDPIDPAKPTIVLTHGWNPLPDKIRTTFGQSAAAALRARCGDSYNLLSWDWNGVRVSPFNDDPLRQGHRQGEMLASALRRRGVDPSRTQIIGHSLGTLVVTRAVECLQDLGPVAQLTLLDAPQVYHEQIFGEHGAQQHALVVENYWSPGISGYGGHVNIAGVRNYIVRGETPVRGIVDLSVSNHVYVMLWYYNTIRCPAMRCGFQSSALLQYCRAERPCYSSASASSAAEAASTSAGSRRR